MPSSSVGLYDERSTVVHSGFAPVPTSPRLIDRVSMMETNPGPEDCAGIVPRRCRRYAHAEGLLLMRHSHAAP